MRAWGSVLRPKDARGRESRTLAFVGLSWLLLTLRFALGGLALDFGAWRFEVAAAALVDYGAAVAAVLAIWLGREWFSVGKSPGGSADDAR